MSLGEALLDLGLSVALGLQALSQRFLQKFDVFSCRRLDWVYDFDTGRSGRVTLRNLAAQALLWPVVGPLTQQTLPWTPTPQGRIPAHQHCGLQLEPVKVHPNIVDRY